MKLKLITSLILFAIFFLSNHLKVNAATSISLDPSINSVAAGQTFTVDVNINTTDSISGYDLLLNFNGDSVTATNYQNSDYLAQGGKTVLPASPVISVNSIRFGAGAFGSGTFTSGNGTLATLTFTANAAGSTNFSFALVIITDQNNSTISSTSSVSNVVITGGTTITPTPTPIPSPTTAINQTSISITPASQSIPTGSTFFIDIPINTNRQISGYDITLIFDSSKITATGFSDQGFLSQNGKTLLPLSPVINEGSIRLGGGAFGNGDFATGNGTLARVSFNAISAGNSPITISSTIITDDTSATLNTTNTSGQVTISMITFTPTPTSPPLPTPTSSPAPSPTINNGPANVNITVHLQGITRQVANQNLNFKLYQNNSLAQTFSNRSASANSNGFYSVNLSQDDSGNDLAAGNYRMCVKAKSHLQRCVNNIAIQAGSNTIDIADEAHMLLVADVDSDNKLNVFDYAKTHTLYTDLSVPVAIGTPQDINHDGQISIVDLSLIIVNFPEKLVLNGDQ